MKHFLKQHQTVVRPRPLKGLKKRRHLSLPLSVDGVSLHRSNRLRKVGRLQITDKKTIATQKQRVVMPARAAQGVEHLRPDEFMPALVLFKPFRPNLKQ